MEQQQQQQEGEEGACASVVVVSDGVKGASSSSSSCLLVVSSALDGEDVSSILRHALELGQRDGVQSALDACLARDRGEIARLARTSCADFVQAIGALGGVRADAKDLRARVAGYCDAMLARGRPAAGLLDELARCHGAVDACRRARRDVRAARHVLGLLGDAEDALAAFGAVHAKPKPELAHCASLPSRCLTGANPFLDDDDDDDDDEAYDGIRHRARGAGLRRAASSGSPHPHPHPPGGGANRLGSGVLDACGDAADRSNPFCGGSSASSSTTASVHGDADAEADADADVDALWSASADGSRLLYRVIRILEDVQSLRDASHPDDDDGDDDAGDDGARDGGEDAAACGPASPLRGFVAGAVRDVKARLEQVLCEDFNKWLLAARTGTRAIALRTLERVRAGVRRADGQARRQARVRAVIRDSWGESVRHILDKAARVDLDGATAGKGEGGDLDGCCMAGVLDFSVLHRCKHLFDRLGKPGFFVDYYCSQRRLQLESDLEFRKRDRASFLDSFTDALTTLLGFFTIERKVAATCFFEGTHGHVQHAANAQVLWAEACEVFGARIKHWMDPSAAAGAAASVGSDGSDGESLVGEASVGGQCALAELHSGSRRVADLCTALRSGSAGLEEGLTLELDVAPFLEVLDLAASKYRENLRANCFQWIEAMCKDDLARKLPRKPKHTGGDAGGMEDATKWCCSVEGAREPPAYSESIEEIVNILLTLVHDTYLFLKDIQVGGDLGFRYDLLGACNASSGAAPVPDGVAAMTDSLISTCLLPNVRMMVEDPHHDLLEAMQLMANLYFGYVPALHGLSRYLAVMCATSGGYGEGSCPAEAAREMSRASCEALVRIVASPDHIAEGFNDSGESMQRSGSGSDPRSVFCLGGEAQDLLFEILDLSEANVLEILSAKVDSYSANYVMMDWLPTKLALAPSSPAAVPAGPAEGDPAAGVDKSECIAEIVSFLADACASARGCMPCYVFRHMLGHILRHTAAHILQLLSCSAIAKFNLLAIVQLRADVKYLRKFAVLEMQLLYQQQRRQQQQQQSVAGGAPDAREPEPEPDVDALFADLVQVVDYLLSCLPESILDPQVKLSLYPLVSTQMLATLLSKYQEMSPGARQQAGASPLAHFVNNAPAKKQVEAVAEKLVTMHSTPAQE